jgi:hypothetical protein
MSSNIVGSGSTSSSNTLWKLYLALTIVLTFLTFLGWYGVQAWEKWSHKRKEAEKEAAMVLDDLRDV